MIFLGSRIYTSFVRRIVSLLRSLFSFASGIYLHATRYSLHALLSPISQRSGLSAKKFLIVFFAVCTLSSAQSAFSATTILETSTTTDPSSIIIGPGTGATTTDTFTFTTDTGTDIITALVVSLSSASSTSLIEITNDAGTIIYGSSTPTTNGTTSVTLNKATLTATTATTTYKIRITPKTQANLPVGYAGVLYPIVAFVQSWTSTNTKVGSDSANVSIIVDNLSLPNFGIATTSTTFSAKVDTTLASFQWGLALGDLNNDGKIDIVVTKWSTAFISVFLNTSTSTFSLASRVDYAVGTNSQSVAIGDLNNDGKMDLAVSNSSSNNVSILLNTSTSTFSLASKVDYITGANPYGIAIGDLNNDRIMDMAVVNAASSTVSTFLNNGNGTFANKVDYTTGSSPYHVAIGDLNNDGKMDLAVTNNGGGSGTTTSILLNTSTSTFSLADKQDYGIGSDPYIITIGDLNNDGKMDLVTANNNSSTISVLLNTSTSTFSLADKVNYTVSLPYGVAIGDLNNDGKMDLVVTANGSTAVSTFLNTSTSTFSLSTNTNYTTGGVPMSVATGDLNNDGKLDIVVANNNSTFFSTILNSSLQSSATFGDSQVTLSYTTPPTSDFSSIIALYGTSTVTQVPVDGTTYSVGNTIGTSTVGCIDTNTATSTASSCVVTGLTNGTSYHFKLFIKDIYGNYSLAVTPSGSPVIPSRTTTLSSSTSTDPSSIIIGPGTSATTTDTFTFTTDAGTDVISSIVVALSSASSTSKVEITSQNGLTVYGSSTNPTGSSTTITLNNTTLTATTATTTYNIRITPKSQANLPIGNQGGLYPIVTFIQSWTGLNTSKVGSDSANVSIIIDNLSVANFWIATSSTSFATQATTTTLGTPADVAIGDLNNDGKMDIVVASYGASSVSTFLNTSTSTFSLASKVDYTTGTQPQSVAIGDLNNDGKKDLVVGNYSSNTVSTFLNTSTSTFSLANKVDYTTGGQPDSVAIGDLNNDGKMDIAVTNNASTSVSILINTSTTTFSLASKVDYTTGIYPYSVAIGDLNNDGKMDLAVANSNSISISIFLNTSTSTFSLAPKVDYTTGSAPRSVAIGDLNNDGKMDLAVANNGSASVSTFLNTSTSTFSLASKVDKTAGANPQSVAIGDINNDGKMDLAVANLGSASVSTFLNTSTSTFSLANKVDYTAGNSTDQVAIGDLNNDGKMDITVSNNGSSSISIFLNSSTSTLSSVSNSISDTQVITSYTTPPTNDISQVLILRSSSVVTDTPVDGTEYSRGSGIGSAVVSCIDSSVATSTVDSCISPDLVTNSTYHFKVFVKDIYGNYSLGVVPSGSPVTLVGLNGSTRISLMDGIDPYLSIISPGDAPTIVDSFALQASTSSSATLSNITVQLNQGSKNDGVMWSTSTSATDNTWKSVTYGNNLFVAVSATSTTNSVMTSPDGSTWTLQTATTSNTWNSITYGNGIFVAVGATSTNKSVMTSGDGTSWTNRTATTTGNNWTSVTYGNGLFVAVSATSSTNSVMTSLDGVTWTPRTGSVANNWSSVTYGNGLFVAVASSTGSNNRVMTSSDGTTWTTRTSASNNAWNSVAYGNGLFVAVSATTTTSNVMTSPDGITWTLRTGSIANNWQSVTYGNGLFTAVANSGTNTRVMTSSDGITWTTRTSPADNNWSSVTYGNGTFIAVSTTGTANRVMKSSSGTTVLSKTGKNGGAIWTGRTSSNIGLISSVTYGSGLFVAVSFFGGNNVMTSPDGVTWTGRTSSNETNAWSSVTYGNGLFVAVAMSGANRVMTSPDGITWTGRTSSNETNGWYSVTYGNGLFVAVANTGTNRIMTSSNGITWTGRTSSNETNEWQSVIYGNGLFVAVAFNGTNRVMTSPDGITWTGRTSSNETNAWTSITYGNGLFVAVANAGTNLVMTSPDGVTWTGRTSSNETNGWFSVTYGNGLFVAVSYSGTSRVMTSPDGITWTGHISSDDTNPSNGWVSVTYGNGQFVAVADIGSDLVMTSSDGFFTRSTSNYQAVGSLEIVSDDELTVYGSVYNPTSDIVTVPLTTPLSVYASSTQYHIRLTPKSHTSMPASESGDTYTIGARVTAFSATSGTHDGEDYATTTTIDNQVNEITFSASSTLVYSTSSTIIPTIIAYGNGRFVALESNGSDALAQVSLDGLNWTTSTSTGTTNVWKSLTYGNSLFVAVADSGTNRVMTSPDGITWTSRTSSSDTNTWQSVTYGNGLFVAVAQSGTNLVMTSPDGITWTGRTSSNVGNYWRSITYGNGLFVAVADFGTNLVMTSPDGISWTGQSTYDIACGLIAVCDNPLSITYGNNLFVIRAMDTSNLLYTMTSQDGVNWVTSSAIGQVGQSVTALYASGKFYISALDASSTPTLYTSTNGTQWTEENWDSFVSVFGISPANLYNKGILATSYGTLSSLRTVQTSNSVSLTFATPPDSDITQAIVVQNTVPITDIPIEGYGTYATGTSLGTSRVACSYAVTASTTYTCTATQAIYNGTPYYFKVFTKDSRGNYSVGISPLPISITPGRTTTLGAGTSTPDITLKPGDSATTTDAFTLQTDTGTDNISSLSLYMNHVSAVGVSLVEITSDDGVTVYGSVVDPVPDSTTNLLSIPLSGLIANTTETQFKIRITPKTHANMPASPGASYPLSPYVDSWEGTNIKLGTTFSLSAESNNNSILTIDNLSPTSAHRAGTEWSARTSANETNGWSSVTYGNGLFVSVANSGTNRVQTSPDGITWTGRTSASENNQWTSITYGNGLFVAVSATTTTGNVMTSSDGVTWTLRTGSSANAWQSVTYGNGLFVAVSISGTSRVMTSPNGITWTPRTSSNETNEWTSVTYGNGLFVAVSFFGTNNVMTSTDGITWTARTSANESNSWTSVTYGNGIFVAVASYGTNLVMTSPDGITWTQRTSSNTSNMWQFVTYGNGLFVAVALGGTNRVMTSPDGITWTARTPSSDANSLLSITYGNGTFVAVASDGTSRVMSSSNPTASSSNSQIAITFTTPADSDITSSLVLIATSTISFTPTEGSTYATSTTLGNATALCSYTVSASTTYTCTATGLTNGNLYYFTIFSRDSSGNWGEGVEVFGNPISPGTNTVTLTSGSTTPSITLAPGASATTSDAFTFQTDSGTDSISSVTVTLPTGTAQALSLIEITNSAGNTVYGSTSTPSTDTPTITLTGLTANTTKTEYRIRVTPKTHANMPAVPGAVYNVTTHISNWVGTAYRHAGTDTDNLASITVDNGSPSVVTIPNSTSVWTARTSSNDTNSWTSVTYGNGIFVAVAMSGSSRVMTSPDGITWTGQTSSNETNSWYSVTYGNGTFVAVSLSGGTDLVMTSSNGVSWTGHASSNETNDWSSVTYGNGLFVAVSQSGTNRVMTSSDGITWTAGTPSSDTNSWTSVTYGNGLFVAVANGGTDLVMTSPDGINWTGYTSANETNTWYSITYGNGLFVAVSYTGTNRVMTSPNGITWTGRTSANETNQWYSVAYGGGLFTAVSYNGTNRVMTSVDGITWTAKASAVETNSWYSVAYGNNTFVAVAWTGASQLAMTSTVVSSTVATSTQVTISFLTPSSSDVTSALILRSTSVITDTPVEGSSYATSSTIGATTAVCSFAVATSTTYTCTSTGLTNGTPYYFKIFTKDTSGNWSEGTAIDQYPVYTGSIVTTIGNGSTTPTVTLYPSSSATTSNTFTLITSSSTDAISSVTVTLATSTYPLISLIEITNNAGGTVYGSVSNPSTDTPSITLTGLTASTTLTQYRIRITPKTHATMPSVPGTTTSFTPYISNWIGTTGVHAGSNATTSAIITVDNTSPSNPTSLSKRISSTESIIISYTNPSDTDATTTLVLRSNTNSFDTPVEGTTYSVGNTLTTSVVACIKNSITPSAVDSCTYTNPARSTRYYFKIFTQDKAGNYSSGAVVSSSPSIIASPAGGGFIESYNGASGSTSGGTGQSGGGAGTGTTTNATTTTSTSTPGQGGGGGGDVGFINYQGSSLAVEDTLYSSFFNFVKSAFTGNAPTVQAETTQTKLQSSCMIEVWGVCLVK